jgi:hypothetical protein
MDKDMRLRARAIRNLKEEEEDYDEDDILAEMDRLLEEEEREERRRSPGDMSGKRFKEVAEAEARKWEAKEARLKAASLEAQRELERSFRVDALRKLKSLGKPYDDDDLELAIADCREAYEAECSRQDAETMKRVEEDQRRIEEKSKRKQAERAREKAERAREIEAAIARGEIDPSDRDNKYSSLDTLRSDKRRRDERKAREEAAEAKRKKQDRADDRVERWWLIGTIISFAAVIGAIIYIIYFLYQYFSS